MFVILKLLSAYHKGPVIVKAGEGIARQTPKMTATFVIFRVCGC